MTDKLDDLEAVRTVVDALSKFDAATQERVIRWSREKLGLNTDSSSTTTHIPAKHSTSATSTDSTSSHGKSSATDIKTFVSTKKPASNNEFTATVAYFYRFEASESDRKDSITAEDLQEACRLSGRARLNKPSQTLVNAHHAGLIDKAGGPGAYSISTVGENLVAMTLPSGENTQRRNAISRRKASKKMTITKAKKAAKKK